MSAVVTALLVLLALCSTAGAGIELDLAHVREQPAVWRVALRSVLANVVVLPMLSFVVVRALELPEDAALALLLVAAAPGGASSPLLARLVGGEPTRVAVVYVALAVSSLASLTVTLPLLAPGPQAGPGGFLVVVAAQLLPLLAGVSLRSLRPRLALRLATPLRTVGSWLLMLVVLLLAATRGSLLVSISAPVLGAMAVLTALSLAVGAAFATRPRLPDALLAGVRNLTLALLIAEARLGAGRVTVMIAAYGLFMYLAVVALTYLRPRAMTSVQP